MTDAWLALIVAGLTGGLIGGIVNWYGLRQAKPKADADTATTWIDAAAALRVEIERADAAARNLRAALTEATRERDDCTKQLEAMEGELEEQQHRRQRQVGELRERLDLMEHAQTASGYRIQALENALRSAGIDPATVNGGGSDAR